MILFTIVCSNIRINKSMCIYLSSLIEALNHLILFKYGIL